MIPKSQYIKSIEQINQSAHNEALRQLDYDLLAERAAIEINMVVRIKNQKIMQRLHLDFYSHICGTAKIKEIVNCLYQWGFVSSVKKEVDTENDLKFYFDSHHPRITEFVAECCELIECGYVLSELDPRFNVYIRIHSKNHPTL